MGEIEAMRPARASPLLGIVVLLAFYASTEAVPLTEQTVVALVAEAQGAPTPMQGVLPFDPNFLNPDARVSRERQEDVKEGQENVQQAAAAQAKAKAKVVATAAKLAGERAAQAKVSKDMAKSSVAAKKANAKEEKAYHAEEAVEASAQAQ